MKRLREDLLVSFSIFDVQLTILYVQLLCYQITFYECTMLEVLGKFLKILAPLQDTFEKLSSFLEDAILG